MEEDNKRRRFFKRAAIATMIGGLAAGAGLKAFAHGGPGRWHGHGFMHGPADPAAMEEHLDRMLKHLYVEIEATEEQKAKLAPIVKSAAKDLLPMRGKAMDARKRAMELLTQPGVDRAAIEQLRAEQISAADAASRRIVLAIGDAAEVLTPGQREALAKRIAKHRRGWSGA